MTRPGWFLAAATTLLLTLTVACGGGGGKHASAAGGSGSTASQSLDLVSTAQKLLTVQGFRFSGSGKVNVQPASGGSGSTTPLASLQGDVKVTGAFAAPGDFEVNLTALGQQVQYVQIGKDAWLNYGDGWKSGDAIDIAGLFDGTVPGMTLPDVVLSGATTRTETVNGRHTTHYAFDKAALNDIANKIAADLGFEQAVSMNDIAAANLDIWITDDGLPIKLQTHVAGDSKLGQSSLDAGFDITDLNSKVTIDRPVP